MNHNEEVLPMLDFALSENPFHSLPSPLMPELAAAEELGQDSGLKLVSEETESSLAARTNPNFERTTLNGILH